MGPGVNRWNTVWDTRSILFFFASFYFKFNSSKPWYLDKFVASVLNIESRARVEYMIWEGGRDWVGLNNNSNKKWTKDLNVVYAIINSKAGQEYYGRLNSWTASTHSLLANAGHRATSRACPLVGTLVHLFNKTSKEVAGYSSKPVKPHPSVGLVHMLCCLVAV